MYWSKFQCDSLIHCTILQFLLSILEISLCLLNLVINPNKFFKFGNKYQKLENHFWQSQASNVCTEIIGQWLDRSAMSRGKILSPPDPMSYLCGLALRTWTSFWRREGSAVTDMWNTPNIGAVKTAFDLQVDGKHGPGRQLTERDCRKWKLSAVSPHDRHTWRSGVRSAMRAASQLPGRGPTDVYVGPVPAR